MSAKIAHRGPDGEGIWLNHEGEITAETPQVGLVHRRLAIIDLDPRANQPFTDGQGRWLVFNGEIYNYRELRKELEGLLPNYAWRTSSDTEVLLASYAAWGEKCVEKLNGMFAFAIWDEGKGELFLARDRMGQKPLYVATPRGAASSAIAFASEKGALNELSWVECRTNRYEIYTYLKWGFSETFVPFFSSVQVLPPGHTKLCPPQTNMAAGTSYFRIDRPPFPEPLDDHHAIKKTRELITTAVKRQLVSDVPVGCFLSGGMDSSVIAAVAQSLTGDGKRMLSFTIGFDDPRYDESVHARRVAEFLGTEHHDFRVRPDAICDLPRLAAVFGEPFADSSALPTHYLARETRKHVKVALSGDGGDELFGGYDRYRAMNITERIRQLPRMLAASASSRIWRYLPGIHPKAKLTRVKRMLRSLELPPGKRYASYLRIFDHTLAGELLNDFQVPDEWQGLIGVAVDSCVKNGRDVVQAALASDRHVYLPQDLLTKVDRCSMLHALEVRSPFMDHELVQFASTLTTPQLLKGGPKRMLREAFADILPAWVFKRKKMGFAVPIGEWFRGPLRAMLRDSLFAQNSFANSHFKMPVVQRLIEEHETQKIDHSQRLYALLMLELWWQQQ
jgi:asparagine synthase (glutamine-hydrolysing)